MYLSMADSRGGNDPGAGRPGAGDCPWDKIRPGKEKPAGIQKGGGPGDRNSAGMAEPAFFYVKVSVKRPEKIYAGAGHKKKLPGGKKRQPGHSGNRHTGCDTGGYDVVCDSDDNRERGGAGSRDPCGSGRKRLPGLFRDPGGMAETAGRDVAA